MSRTMVALDFSKKEDVMNFLDKFDKPIYVKVGMELTYAFGFEMIREIKARWKFSMVMVLKSLDKSSSKHTKSFLI